MATTFSSATAQYFARQTRIRARVLVWISARDRDTGATESMGIWNGADHKTFTIQGVDRLYYGAGGLISIDPITSRTGLTVRMQRLVFSPLAPEVEQVIRGYDVRFAPIEIHRAVFDPDTHNLMDEPHRRFRGYVDKISPLKTGPKGDQVRVELQLASAARALTIPLSRRRSDETLRARSAEDAFRQYADVAGTISVMWGMS